MNNLPADLVLFAFAEAADEDYLFRLIKLGMAASGRRFAVVVGAVAAITCGRCANRAAMIRNAAMPDIHAMTQVVLEPCGVAL